MIELDTDKYKAFFNICYRFVACNSLKYLDGQFAQIITASKTKFKQHCGLSSYRISKCYEGIAICPTAKLLNSATNLQFVLLRKHVFDFPHLIN